MARIIITDLTRFSNGEIVCTAGTDIASRACIRPMPYLKTADCVGLNILPGAVLSGEFTPKKDLNGPHQEDAEHAKLQFEGPCSNDEFRDALIAGLFDSVGSGFEIELANGQKHVPIGHPIKRSIITLSVRPQSIQIEEDGYKPGKIKIHFTDASGRNFRYLPITDLGFHRYAEKHHAAQDLASLNAFIWKQQETFLRIGLSREHTANGTIGYWMQVNGIYTFPNFIPEIRSYK